MNHIINKHLNLTFLVENFIRILHTNFRKVFLKI